MEKNNNQVIIELKIKKDNINGLLDGLKGLEDITSTKLVSYEGDLEEG